MRRRTILVAPALAALALAGCGSRPSLTPVAGGLCVPPRGTNLAAPGRFRVATASIPFARTAADGRPRSIDPTVWYPVATRSGAPVRCRSALVLFSHGANGRPTDYSRLLSHLASDGFVVLAPHHPDRQNAHRTERVERVADVRYLLDHLRAVLDRVAPGLAEHVDASAVATAGHSFGAFTAAELAATDRRVRADLVMAGGSRPDAAAAIRVPTFAMAGASDKLIPAALVERFVAALPPNTPHGLLVIGGAGHGAYGDGCGLPRTCAIVARYSSAFLLTYLDGLRWASAALDPRAPRARRLTLRTEGMPPR